MNNDEKILSLLENVVARLDKMQDEVEKVQDQVKEVQNQVKEVNEKVEFVRNVTVRIENDHGKKLDVIFDGYAANYELIGRYDPRVTKLERDLEKLSFEIRYLKAAK